MSVDNLYCAPRRGVKLDDCWFYHTIDLPGIGLVKGHWDLREVTAQYLGDVTFDGKRVLEIGPASGYLTAHMDRQGAEVVAVEQPESAVWDFVPYGFGEAEWRKLIETKRVNNEKLKNSFWLTHEKCGLKARAHYGKVEALPEEIGQFDIAVIALVLTHMRDPVAALAGCARRVREKLVVVERTHGDEPFKNRPVMQLIPNKENKRYDSWWYFSPAFFAQLFDIMGFRGLDVSECVCDVNGKPYPVTTYVASRQ